MLLLPATITMRESRDTLRLLAQSLRADNEAGVVVDASPLQHFDTSALAVLLECRRLAQAWGKPFAVRNPPAKLTALARLYGIEELLVSAEAPAAAA